MEGSTHFVGLDIGGTTVKAALLNESGRQVGDGVEVRSHGSDGYQATFKQLRAAIDQLCSDNSIESSNITAVGIDVPAPSSDGVIWGQANLNEDWVGTNIRDEFSKEIHRPCYMTNDGTLLLTVNGSCVQDTMALYFLWHQGPDSVGALFLARDNYMKDAMV